MGELVYLVSVAGHPNFGDEAIVAGWLRFLARVRPNAEVVLDCPHPAAARTLFQGMHPHLSVTDALWRACDGSPVKGAAGVWAHVESLVLAETEPDFEPLTRAASIHLLGGGYLNAVWPHQAGVVAGIAAARQLSGAALFGTGLGLLPACPDLPQLTSVLHGFDHVSCRDRPSAQRFGLPTGLDDLFLGITTNFQSFRTAPHRARDVMVCVQQDLIHPEAFALATALLRARIRECLDEGKTVGYVEALPASDRQMFESLEGLLSEADLIPFAELWDDGFPARPGQHWYASRFHLHLSAAARGAAGTALGVAPGYYDIKHRSLVELGTGWRYAGLEGLGRLPYPTFDASFPERCRMFAAVKQAEATSLSGASALPDPYKDSGATKAGRMPAARAGMFAGTNVRAVHAG
ncbi:MAG: polysaccharide pyruvyl transferase family protein [Micrococcaceae bacterium]|jgi:hypothetical protein|nr:polysaccharide pyruvyl transferase family protein [Micrococcaceae bacterium]